MEQSRAINALAPFLALSKSANSPRAAADLVTQATSAQNTYVFAELLQTAAIQNLRQDAQYANHYRLLEIFAWGTWEDYHGRSLTRLISGRYANRLKAAAGSLPPLSDVQSHKLRLLTLLTLASRCTSSSQLTYGNLQRALSLTSSIELEQLVTDAIYANLLTGTLNPAQQIVIINSVAPLRDLAPGSVGAMMAELEAWSQRCEGVLKDLEAEMTRVKQTAAKRAWNEAETAAQIARAEKISEGAAGGMDTDRPLGGRVGMRSGGGRLGRQDTGDGMGGDAMEVDSGGGGGGANTKKKGIFGGRKR